MGKRDTSLVHPGWTRNHCPPYEKKSQPDQHAFFRKKRPRGRFLVHRVTPAARSILQAGREATVCWAQSTAQLSKTSYLAKNLCPGRTLRQGRCHRQTSTPHTPLWSRSIDQRENVVAAPFRPPDCQPRARGCVTIPTTYRAFRGHDSCAPANTVAVLQVNVSGMELGIIFVRAGMIVEISAAGHQQHV